MQPFEDKSDDGNHRDGTYGGEASPDDSFDDEESGAEARANRGE